MAKSASWIDATSDGSATVWSMNGEWTVHHAEAINRQLQGMMRKIGKAGRGAQVVFNLRHLTSLDSAGAWLLVRGAQEWRTAGAEVDLRDLDPKMKDLLQRVVEAAPAEKPPMPHRRTLLDWIAQIGAALDEVWTLSLDLLAFFGSLSIVFFGVVVNPRRLRLNSVISHIEQVGLNALPIVGLINFLVGVVLAYQGVDQLSRFGAQVFTVNMVGISVLREMGILLTAIVIAGRSGSAFTAQIGTMKVNEEVDALETMGLNPVEILVLPRVLALVIALPLLTFFADLMGLLGAGVMCVVLLDMSFQQYLHLLQQAISLSQFWVGVIKAPVFAILIALIGCFEGLRVTGSAESVGRQTTRSVVEGIFLVIVFDAFFSVLFSMLGV